MTSAIDIDFPCSPDDVTKDWVSSTIGAANGNVVSELSLSQFGEEQGASALVFRAQIVWRDVDDLPKSIIFKFASAKEEFREFAKNMGTYLKEVRFYQTFSTDVLLPLPRIFFSEIDEPSGHFLIVMEDLAEARMSKWFGDGVEDVRLALVPLASIHARYWNDDALRDHQWLGCADEVGQCNQYKNLLEQLLPPAKEKFGSLLSDYSWTALDAWLENWESVRLATSKGSKTLVHREADMRQMFFPTQKVNRFILFDWQSPEIGWGAADACRMITTSLSLSIRRQHEEALVVLYADKLKECGVIDLPNETLWYQIKLSLLMNVLAHMFSLLWVETEETEVWQQDHLGILGAALEDWKLLDVIETVSNS